MFLVDFGYFIFYYFIENHFETSCTGLTFSLPDASGLRLQLKNFMKGIASFRLLVFLTLLFFFFFKQIFQSTFFKLPEYEFTVCFSDLDALDSSDQIIGCVDFDWY
ncbi:hypothetical protein RhiirA1_506151 [Rhizophagus irregularis]|uniref:Uncharacterized protein n=1 Tax=Rhizophagus irregularis TaxID=588596 RepID=A0A2N0QU50_9GLOM|nr:hypothetical protein RhiirA1_506151 [Rhizophagus irregularis]